MVSYRITKFDPEKRDKHGAYQDDAEWTSMSDIGNPAYHSITFADYAQVETAYVNAVKVIMAYQGVASLKIQDLESHFVTSKKKFEQYRSTGGFEGLQIDYKSYFKEAKNEIYITGEQLDNMVRLVLREHLWMLLVSDKVEVQFGYDYYMYIKCARLNPATINQIKATGLFVEENIERLKFAIISYKFS